MKKDDFKKSIDNINPDAYMGNRLKAKITTVNVPVKRNRQITLSITAFCLAFAIIFGVGFLSPSKTPAPQQNTTENTVVQNETVNAFIMIASAANSESTETATVNKTIELNEEYPYEVYLRVSDTRGISNEEKSNLTQKLIDAFSEYCQGKMFDSSRVEIFGRRNISLLLCALNEFRIDLDDTENVKSINVKNISKYGQMVYETNKPTFSAPEHGNDITVSGEKFDFEKSGFYWDRTEEMVKAFEENINVPFSTFNDTITFTVEYKDGSKAIGVIDLVFDDSGNATAVCKNYDYVS